jgi:hypothetical protein
MAKSALGRRRGTKARNQGHGLLAAVLGGMALLGVGLVVGLVVGLFMYGGASDPAASVSVSVSGEPAALPRPTTTKEKLVGVANLLRKPKLQVPSLTAPAAEAVPNLEHAQSLRHAQGVQPIQEQPQPVVNGAGAGTVSEFISRTAKIGGQGPFPHYPSDGLVSPTHDFTTFTAPGGFRFDEYKSGDSPYDYDPGESDALARSRRAHVRHAMEHAWGNYQQHAYGMDEMLPATKNGQNNWGGMGTTLVDALDTLYLMNMTAEFNQARDWVQSSLNHNRDRDVSVFETTIRSLGGLLSAYDWSRDPIFLSQAKDLGARLFHAFSTPSGIPTGQVNLARGGAGNPGWTGGNAITAEFGTLQLEFRTLARLSGVADYKTKSEHVYDLLIDMAPQNGLYPYFIRNRGPAPEFANDKITFGAMGDSLYEYMLKIWIQGGKVETKYRNMYDKAIQGMHDRLLQVSSPSNLVFIADRNNGRLDTKMDHLVCFMGGSLALGAYTDPQGFDSERAQRDLKTGKVSRREKIESNILVLTNLRLYI